MTKKQRQKNQKEKNFGSVFELTLLAQHVKNLRNRCKRMAKKKKDC